MPKYPVGLSLWLFKACKITLRREVLGLTINETIMDSLKGPGIMPPPPEGNIDIAHFPPDSPTG